MMETGTGKTFTYIKTIFELSTIGYKKFILLVPSIPIRENSAAGFEDTKTYFKQVYANSKEREIALYVYEAGKKEIVEQFVGNLEELSCLILTPASFSAKENILNRPLEKDFFRPAKSYLELLKLMNPIVIMDEPHKFEGAKFKEYFQGFGNYYLRFGATFPLPDKKGETIPFSKLRCGNGRNGDGGLSQRTDEEMGSGGMATAIRYRQQGGTVQDALQSILRLSLDAEQKELETLQTQRLRALIEILDLLRNLFIFFLR